jgi:hypothetical protein
MKKASGEWIRVDASRFNRVQKEEPEGTKLETAPSPYDLPEAVRGHLDPSTGAFVIDIRYVTSEPTEEIWRAPVSFFRGAGSGRIYQIKVLTPDDPEWAMNLPKKIHETLRSLETGDSETEMGSRQNRTIAIVENVLKSERDSLFPTPQKTAPSTNIFGIGVEQGSALDINIRQGGQALNASRQPGVHGLGIVTAQTLQADQPDPVAQLHGGSASYPKPQLRPNLYYPLSAKS